MKPAGLPLLEAVRRLLEVEAGGEGHAAGQEVATATRFHDKLARHLSPVVGEAGFDALFSRSIKMTKSTFPSLCELETTGSPQSVLSRFFEHLEKEDPASVQAFTESLVMTLLGMLSAFIGEGLTWQLLRNAWPTLPNEPPSEKTA
jgi:hypothetical protein